MVKQYIYLNNKKYKLVGSYVYWPSALNKIRSIKARKGKYFLKKGENWLFPQTMYNVYEKC